MGDWYSIETNDITHLSSSSQGYDLPLKSENLESEKVYHSYYRRVEFVLIFQCLLFYLPNWLWKRFEGGFLAEITKNFRNGKLNTDADFSASLHEGMQDTHLGLNPRSNNQTNTDTLVKDMEGKMNSNQCYVGGLIFCDWLNLINVLCQILIIDWFCDGIFYEHGTNVLYLSANYVEDGRIDQMINIFPRLTKCTYHKYGPFGLVENYDAQCLLPYNEIN